MKQGRKAGGRVAKRGGGGFEKHDEKGRAQVAKHHEGASDLAHAEHVGAIQGRHGRHHAGHKPRKSGGGVGADRHPFSSAKPGTEPPGRHTMPDD